MASPWILSPPFHAAIAGVNKDMDRSFVDQYARSIGLLNYATSGLTVEELHSRPGPGAWSTAEVVFHLADADLVLADRMKRIIAEEHPALLAFDENR